VPKNATRLLLLRSGGAVDGWSHTETFAEALGKMSPRRNTESIVGSSAKKNTRLPEAAHYVYFATTIKAKDAEDAVFIA